MTDKSGGVVEAGWTVQPRHGISFKAPDPLNNQLAWIDRRATHHHISPVTQKLAYFTHK